MYDDAFTYQSFRPGQAATQAYDIAQRYYAGGAAVPHLKGSHNATFDWGSLLPPQARLREMARDLSPESVITGIIDSGIAVANARFLSKDRSPRVLASWQQTARFDRRDNRNLPFGDVSYAKDIKRAIEEHTFGQWCDEDSVNRALQISQFGTLLGQRDVELHAAHGTHVADLAAGFDPEDDVQDRPILCVNLPDRVGHGSAGNFLEYYAVFALEWMIDLSDALWQTAKARWVKEGIAIDESANGFKLVINLSYGKQAGPKDGSMAFEKACQNIQTARTDAGKSAVYFVLPAGNDNLERCHAQAVLGTPALSPQAEQEVTFNWRMMPDDKTSNFVEIWSSPILTDGSGGPLIEPVLTLCDPSGQLHRFEGTAHKPLVKLTATTWLYYNRYSVEVDGVEHLRLRYIICTRPTLSYQPLTVETAGLWAITIEYMGAASEFSLHVQSDQALREDSRTGLRSYFDHPAYHTHTDQSDTRRIGMPTGAKYIPIGTSGDSYFYPDGTHLENWLHRGPVQRKGSLNALVSTQAVLAIGGYRRSDGAPALYSSTTGEALLDEAMQANAEPARLLTALLPTDDGVAHLGLRASGPRSGSIAVMQGTSMGAARATRHLVDTLLDGTAVTQTNGRPLFPIGDQTDPNWPLMQVYQPLKLGHGRILPKETAKVDRLGRQALAL